MLLVVALLAGLGLVTVITQPSDAPRSIEPPAIAQPTQFLDEINAIERLPAQEKRYE